MSRFRLSIVNKTTCPKRRSNSHIWAGCILKFCKLRFVDCMILGRHFMGSRNCCNAERHENKRVPKTGREHKRRWRGCTIGLQAAVKISHKLCDQAQTIFAEDLNVTGLTRGMLGKDCVDFLSLTEWVCWKRGVYFAKVNPNGTSQTCPNCLATVSKGLEVREHHCPECGYWTHRDHAAAEMVLHRGLEKTLGNGNRLSSL